MFYIYFIWWLYVEKQYVKTRHKYWYKNIEEGDYIMKFGIEPNTVEYYCLIDVHLNVKCAVLHVHFKKNNDEVKYY